MRGLTTPYIGTHCLVDGKEIKVWKSAIVTDVPNNIEPGKVLHQSNAGTIIKCGTGAICLTVTESLFEPSISLLIILLSLFGWMSLSDYVRAEFLKGRNMEYVIAARTLGLTNTKIILKHILPNSMVSVITFLPFRISGAILILTSIDFLGLGVPPDTQSLGELLAQGKENIEAWWLSLSTFFVLVGTLLLLIFIGEGVRESLDTRSS